MEQYQIKKQNLQTLLDRIDYYKNEYYNNNRSIVSDKEYDELAEQAEQLSQELNDVSANKKIQKVGAYPLSGFQKVEHSKPMLSAAKTKDVEVIDNFISKYDCYCSYKLDGLTLYLKYENGELVQGLTRGNGHIGEDVTEQCRLIPNVPLKLSLKSTLEIRGECVISWEEFRRINEQLEEPYSHPRNLAAGTLRTLDLSVLKQRKLSFVAFEVITDMGQDKLQTLKNLNKLGIETVETCCCENTQDCIDRMSAENSIYPVDGLVFEVRDLAISQKMGATSHHENCRIAFKWQDTVHKTVLRDIEWQTSRSGLINPVAVFDAVDLDGALTQRSTLHNINYIEDLQLGIGDTIEVYRSNMVIPKVCGNLTKSGGFIMPDKCPACEGKVELRHNNGTKTLHCTNPNCQAQLLSKLTHFVSKNCMNIPQLSTKTLERFIELGWVKSFTDLYYLDLLKEQLLQLEGFGDKSVNSLLSAIQNSRQVKLSNFLCALSCPMLGKTASKILEKEFKGSIEDFMTAMKTGTDLSYIEGFGDIMAETIINFFTENIIWVENLIKQLTFLPTEQSGDGQKLKGLTFVVTGSLDNFKNRDELINTIVDNGGKVSGSVSKNTSYLINNDYMSTSGKNKKAQQLNIPIITEKQFIELVSKDMKS